MKDFILRFISIIGVFLLVIWLVLLFIFKIYITPFTTYYFENSYYENIDLNIKDIKIDYLLSSNEGIFAIDTKQRLVLLIENNEKNRDINLVSIKVLGNDKKELYFEEFNTNLFNLKDRIKNMVIIEKNENYKNSGKSYLIFEDKKLKPSKYEYLNIEFIFKYKNKIIKIEKKILRRINDTGYRGLS